MIRHIVAYKGGTGKTHLAILMAHLLPDPVVIEHVTAADAAKAFPTAITMPFTGEPDQDLLTLEAVIGAAADHQNIVINTPPAKELTAIAVHADLLKAMGEQFGHETEVYLVVDETPIHDRREIQGLIETIGPSMHTVFNEKHGRSDPGQWPFAEAMLPLIFGAGMTAHTLPPMPHRDIGAFLRDRKTVYPLMVRTLAKRYLLACQEALFNQPAN